MNDFNWRNQPRTTVSPARRHVVADPLPINFNGGTLKGTLIKPPNARIYKTTKDAKP